MTFDAAPPMPRTPDPTAAVFETERGPIWIAGEGQVVNVGTYVRAC